MALPLASAALLAGTTGASPAVRERLGPGELSGEDRKAIVEAVRLFDRCYQDVFSSGGGAAMIDAFPATRDVKHHVFRDVGFLRDAGLVLVQDLADFTVLDLRRTGPDAAEALVLEEWNYLYQRAEDRRPAAQVKGMGQGFRYRLRWQRDRWIVAGWAFEDVKPAAQDKGFTF
jgi:hypothetical protein